MPIPGPPIFGPWTSMPIPGPPIFGPWTSSPGPPIFGPWTSMPIPGPPIFGPWTSMPIPGPPIFGPWTSMPIPGPLIFGPWTFNPGPPIFGLGPLKLTCGIFISTSALILPSILGPFASTPIPGKPISALIPGPPILGPFISIPASILGPWISIPGIPIPPSIFGCSIFNEGPLISTFISGSILEGAFNSSGVGNLINPSGKSGIFSGASTFFNNNLILSSLFLSLVKSFISNCFSTSGLNLSLLNLLFLLLNTSTFNLSPSKLGIKAELNSLIG